MLETSIFTRGRTEMNVAHIYPEGRSVAANDRARALPSIAGKPAPTGVSPAPRLALYLWEPRLPAMGREAAPIYRCPLWLDSSDSRLTAFAPLQPFRVSTKPMSIQCYAAVASRVLTVCL